MDGIEKPKSVVIETLLLSETDGQIETVYWE